MFSIRFLLEVRELERTKRRKWGHHGNELISETWKYSFCVRGTGGCAPRDHSIRFQKKISSPRKAAILTGIKSRPSPHLKGERGNPFPIEKSSASATISKKKARFCVPFHFSNPFPNQSRNQTYSNNKKNIDNNY